jgi:hypothetical protein
LARGQIGAFEHVLPQPPEAKGAFAIL